MSEQDYEPSEEEIAAAAKAMAAELLDFGFALTIPLHCRGDRSASIRLFLRSQKAALIAAHNARRGA